MSDLKKLTATCPACKTGLKVRVEVDFDASVDLECEGQRDKESLFFIQYDAAGNIITPMVNDQRYRPMIPNVGVLPRHYPEGKIFIHGVERPFFLFENMFLLDKIPFLSSCTTELDEYAGRDWTASLAKHFDFNLSWFNVYPCETNNAITAMRTETGELLCYANRNQLDLFHAMSTAPTFTFPKEGSLICVYDSKKGIMFAGTTKHNVKP